MDGKTKLNNLGWKVEINLQQGVENTYQWFLEHHNDMKFIK